MYDLETATLLETYFDLDEILMYPGLYVAVAETDAYPLLMASTIAGETELVGERYDVDGRKIITVLVPGEPQEMALNPAIGIGREFFVTALKDYNDWQEKWFREAIQNSIDAGATQIDITCEELPDKTWRISCEDNGSGMDEDTLLNKFLVLGGTTKVGGDTAGGFGKAKELLVLPWLSWEIHSRWVMATGSGIQYETQQVDYREGTRLTVIMPADQHTHEAPAIDFIMKCYLPNVRFTVNTRVVKANLISNNVIADLADKAIAYYVKGNTEHSRMLIRATGDKFNGSLYMFDRWLSDSVNGYVVIDLTQSSVKLLTANRDGFRDYYLQREVEALGNRIAADTTSALKAKQGLITKKYKGTGKFEAKEMQNNLVDAMINIGGFQKDSSEQIDSTAVEQIVELIEREREVSHDQKGRPLDPIMQGPIDPSGMNSVLTEMLLTQEFAGQQHYENVLKQLVWTPDFIITNEIEGFKIPAKFKPETMTPTVLKLIKVWTELCRFVLAQLNCGVQFGVGFIFAEGSFAACRSDPVDGYWLMLNPLFKNREDGEIRQLNPERDADLRMLYEIAIHECTHMADGISYHDEAFASALTLNNAKCSPGWKKIRALSDSIKTRGQA